MAKKYVSKAKFEELVKERVEENEKRELSVSEHRDPAECVPNWDFYVNELSAEYTTSKPRKPKAKKKGKRGK